MWKEMLLADLKETATRASTEEATPALAYELACDMGYARPYLPDAGIDPAEFPAKLRMPALNHLRDISILATQRASKLSSQWLECSIEGVEALSFESQSLLQTFHGLHCAWSVLLDCQFSESDEEPVDFSEAEAALHDFNERLRQDDARDILAAAWEYLDELLSRYPEDCEFHGWWYLCRGGRIHRAHEEVRIEAEQAIKQFKAILRAGRRSS